LKIGGEGIRAIAPIAGHVRRMPVSAVIEGFAAKSDIARQAQHKLLAVNAC
jgi:hypothetical protein